MNEEADTFPTGQEKKYMRMIIIGIVIGILFICIIRLKLKPKWQCEDSKKEQQTVVWLSKWIKKKHTKANSRNERCFFDSVGQAFVLVFSIENSNRIGIRLAALHSKLCEN